jgi:hypothetical protein
VLRLIVVSTLWQPQDLLWSDFRAPLCTTASVPQSQRQSHLIWPDGEFAARATTVQRLKRWPAISTAFLFIAETSP